MPRERADWGDEEPPVDVGGGSVSTAGAESELSALALSLGADLWRLAALLEETDAEEWERCRARIGRVLALADALPRGPARRRRAIGFGPDGLARPARRTRGRR